MRFRASFLLYGIIIFFVAFIVIASSISNSVDLNSDRATSIDDLDVADTYFGPKAQCNKLGINYAWPWPTDYWNAHSRAEGHNMGYTLELIAEPSQIQYHIESMNRALDRGLTPIVRICVGVNCPWRDPNNYINLLNILADNVGGRTFYALAGPNEPLGEPWTVNGANNSTKGNYSVIGPATASYMNTIINGVDKQNVKLLSPAFNLTHPNFGELIAAMNSANANWAGLDGIAGNAYNLKGYNLGGSTHGGLRETVNSQVARLKEAGFEKPVFLTEIGMFEVDTNPSWTGTRVPRAEAIENLRTQINILKEDNQVYSYLLFNSFGINSDPNFNYNVISDQEIRYIVGENCIGELDPDPIPTDLEEPEPVEETVECVNQDSNGDGRVDIVDLVNFVQKFNKDCSE